MTADDVAAFLARLEHLDGDAVHLEPFQRQLLEALLTNRDRFVATAYRGGRRRLEAIGVAAAIATDTPVTIVGNDAEAIRLRALELLDRMDRELGDVRRGA